MIKDHWEMSQIRTPIITADHKAGNTYYILLFIFDLARMSSTHDIAITLSTEDESDSHSPSNSDIIPPEDYEITEKFETVRP